MEEAPGNYEVLVNRIRSKSGKFIALIHENPDYGFSVVATKWAVAAFIASWPCSKLQTQPVRFEFDTGGNLVDISPEQVDGADLLALSHDAQEFGEKCKRKLATLNPG
jgi:hypothetical protein